MSTASSQPEALIDQIREASRSMVRELGFMQSTLAATDYPASAVHALLEIGARRSMTAVQLASFLGLEKSSVSRMVRKLINAGEISEASHEDARSKSLHLTLKGQKTVAAIEQYGRAQVTDALNCLSSSQRQLAATGLSCYANALALRRTGAIAEPPAIEVVAGYQPGAIAQIVLMHAQYYSRTVGFGSQFESKVAAGLAEFVPRLTKSCNGLWLALQGGQIVGSIAIDGEDLGKQRAHLRWFIVSDAARGSGAGRQLLETALVFCDAQGFAATHLWTFQGLDAARRLYETHGFQLTEHWQGTQWGKEMVEQSFVRAQFGVLPGEQC
ncbi:DNA-binding MarR family transcriptional regulator/GNAT superfamily N-acetyltransferase [Herbaspirillum sp. Sphag1AN]|uniref:bifunctional helix-turn-helix transcriptional regulator/GNAT family N-acetyltransferase n=1 Tax=unclassified Herbaspirillum TaxID=2624150 RepID=UPI00161FFE0D|nr:MULTISPECIES: bifunctional helix-turn-helix transcriptional regulator/GNAT family N-acetyltransferase [unclassified Herbaspirillum]MBB3213312.1 DNA-binding MarR family transcriptional regulator/GNAT superfamily N-acetyltransferase [Herbaspirillum sp. Sphag1AN]MBB3246644.1 DNA-binding MarR family transcriptional regulator/GNAT superfamily N-acetyltransferase [Herbaspirillum sp. Sphag64]